ncbi:Bifunctional adenosylcobalamin biosynthesis protein CobP [uncultured Gammaproteobacteria bacterium]
MSIVPSLPPLTLVLGGARSGKSRHAEALIMALPPPWVYLATASAGDSEMRERIEAHRSRRGPEWRTVEEPFDLSGALLTHARDGMPVLVDCLTLWLSNLMLYNHDVGPDIVRLIETLPGLGGPVVMVSNEIGLGIVPDNPLARAFRDHAGRLHAGVAECANRVQFMLAGLAMTVK